VISDIANIVSYFESRLPIAESIGKLQEKLPIEELAPKLADLAKRIANEAPPPDEVIRTLGSILIGGSPFDSNRKR